MMSSLKSNLIMFAVLLAFAASIYPIVNQMLQPKPLYGMAYYFQYRDAQYLLNTTCRLRYLTDDTTATVFDYYRTLPPTTDSVWQTKGDQLVSTKSRRGDNFEISAVRLNNGKTEVFIQHNYCDDGLRP